MKVLVYSDVHGNLPAFEKILEENKDCGQFICLGDLVNYGPWSNECVDLALSLQGKIVVMGNHEEAFINGVYPGSNELVQLFFNQCYTDFDRKEIIQTFLPDLKMKDIILTHTLDGKNIYPDTDIILDANYMIGHSHHQFVYQNSGYTLWNAGSVGQNRKYINKADYLVWDMGTNKIELKSTVFDIDMVITEMKKRNYPQLCLDYYLKKGRV